MINEKQSIAQIVLDYPECAPVFQHHRIDYCCDGERTVEIACRQRGVDQVAFVSELQKAAKTYRGASIDPRQWSTPVLIAHIVSCHHGYLRQALPLLRPLAAKVAAEEGERFANLRKLNEALDALTEMIMAHIGAEEKLLFPALLSPVADAATVRRLLSTLQQEHTMVDKHLVRLRAASNDYQFPETAGSNYRILCLELETLEADLLYHVHLENHVLLPRFTTGTH